MIQSIKTTWNDLQAFLKSPKDERDSNQSASHKGKILLSVLAIDVPIMGVLISLIALVEQLGLIDTQNHKMNEFLQNTAPWIIILNGVIVIPFIEELLFRVYLRKKYNPIQLLLLLSSVLGKQLKEELTNLVDIKWRKYYAILFYFSAILFAVVHISNFELSTSILLLTPILVAPQFVMGLFIGYLRVKFGFIWGFFLHALHNFIFLVIPLALMPSPLEEVSVTNENHFVKINFFQNVEMNPLITSLHTTVQKEKTCHVFMFV